VRITAALLPVGALGNARTQCGPSTLTRLPTSSGEPAKRGQAHPGSGTGSRARRCGGVTLASSASADDRLPPTQTRQGRHSLSTQLLDEGYVRDERDARADRTISYSLVKHGVRDWGSDGLQTIGLCVQPTVGQRPVVARSAGAMQWESLRKARWSVTRPAQGAVVAVHGHLPAPHGAGIGGGSIRRCRVLHQPVQRMWPAAAAGV
jgi:hypothetical protein